MSKTKSGEFRKTNLPTSQTGTFNGQPGNSGFVPNDQAALDKMQSFGQDHVNYVNGYPDFTPFTAIHDDKLGDFNGQVEIGHMTKDRQNGHYEYGRRSDSHAANEDIGNFAQADNELAKALSKQKGLSLTGKDIQQMRERNGLTWHEVQDGKTMQLVPREIHDACRHSGGVATTKDVNRIVAESGDYDFDTGVPNPMEEVYAAENWENVPIDDLLDENRNPNGITGDYSNGASYLMSRENYDRYYAGNPYEYLGRDNNLFVAPSGEMDQLLAEYGDNPRMLENKLGLGEGALGNGEIMRVDIPNAKDYPMDPPGYTTPGSNDNYIPGGKTSGGISEAVMHDVPTPQNDPSKTNAYSVYPGPEHTDDNDKSREPIDNQQDAVPEHDDLNPSNDSPGNENGADEDLGKGSDQELESSADENQEEGTVEAQEEGTDESQEEGTDESQEEGTDETEEDGLESEDNENLSNEEETGKTEGSDDEGVLNQNNEETEEDGLESEDDETLSNEEETGKTEGSDDEDVLNQNNEDTEEGGLDSENHEDLDNDSENEDDVLSQNSDVEADAPTDSAETAPAADNNQAQAPATDNSTANAPANDTAPSNSNDDGMGME